MTLKALQAFKLKLKATGKHFQESLLNSGIKKIMSLNYSSKPIKWWNIVSKFQAKGREKQVGMEITERGDAALEVRVALLNVTYFDFRILKPF